MSNFNVSKKYDVLGIGEVMLRLSPIGKERISHCETFEKQVGGSEFNVVCGASMLGLKTGIITKLPKNDIGKFAKRRIRYATDDAFVLYDSTPTARLGIYYYESGAYPRLPSVFYDRKNSSFTSLTKDEIPESLYSSSRLFHTSGITLALCEPIRETVIGMIRRFKKEGTLVSFDVNYRAALWSEEEAREVVLKVLPLTDVLFVSEETLRRMLKMSGSLKEIQGEIGKKYKNLKIIASTRRKVLSPGKHSFSSLVYDCEGKRHFEDLPYENIDVVDRIGSGDAYVAGAIYALLEFGRIEEMARYGDAMAALKNTIIGDTTECDVTDIERIIRNHSGTEPSSEMMR